MRLALISLAAQPRHAGGRAVAVAGKTVARRQLDLALVSGCERILALGGGEDAEVAALAETAERAGARFQVIPDAHGLLGLVRATDELLAIAPGLIAETPIPREPGGRIYTLSADKGVPAGFERIDRERAWAGILVVQGGVVERLAELPADCEPAAALLRIALQARVPDREIQPEDLADGRWSMARGSDDPAMRDSDWLRRHERAIARFAVTDRAARFLLAPFANALLEARAPARWFAGGAGVLSLFAFGASVAGFPVVGFLLLALAGVGVSLADRLKNLSDAPFVAQDWLQTRLLAKLNEAALVGCSIFAISGPWLNRAFAPLALIAALHAIRPEGDRSALALLGERVVIALALAAAAAFGAVEPVVMALVLIILLLPPAVRSGAKRG